MRGIFALHSDSNIGNGSVVWSAMAGVVRSPCVVFFLEATSERCSPTADAARPPRIVLSWWRLQGSLRVAWVRCFFTPSGGVFATASLRRVLHSGGFLGAVVSSSFNTYRRLVTPEVSTSSRVWFMGGCYITAFGFAALVEWSGGFVV